MINKSILQKALNVIKERRIDAENFAYANLQKAFLYKDYKENYTKLKEAEFENAKCEAYGEPPKFDMQKLKQNEQEILEKHNINYLSLIPHYTCTKCNDTGYKNGEMCSCLKDEINKVLFEESGFCHTLASFDSVDFSVFDSSEKMKILYGAMQKWCDDSSKYSIILLSGKTGVGKTYLTECMSNELIKNSNIVYFVSAFSVNQSLLKYHTTFDTTKAEYLSSLLEPEYLFIDDLGTEPILKNVTVEGLYNIIATRLEQNKKTIISTNLDLGEIEQRYGERIFSRLINKKTSLCFAMENSDLRLKR